MRPPKLYAAFAVILPVSLGLGLVYLTIVGRIEPAAAVISTLVLAGVIGALIFLRDFASDDERDEHPGHG